MQWGGGKVVNTHPLQSLKRQSAKPQDYSVLFPALFGQSFGAPYFCWLVGRVNLFVERAVVLGLLLLGIGMRLLCQPSWSLGGISVVAPRFALAEEHSCVKHFSLFCSWFFFLFAFSVVSTLPDRWCWLLFTAAFFSQLVCSLICCNPCACWYPLPDKCFSGTAFVWLETSICRGESLGRKPLSLAWPAVKESVVIRSARISTL